MKIDISEASVYVGTYFKYNEGSIFGEWLNISDYSSKEEFYDACTNLHCDEVDPEFMFQDFENIPAELISESWISDNIFEVFEALGSLDEDIQTAFFIWCNNANHNLSSECIYNLIKSFENAYQGEYRNEEDFAYEWVEQNYNLIDFCKQYFDYEAFARDLFCSDYWFEDGYVFSYL